MTADVSIVKSIVGMERLILRIWAPLVRQGNRMKKRASSANDAHPT